MRRIFLAVLLVVPFVLIPHQVVMAQNCTIAISASGQYDCPDCEVAEIVITNTTRSTNAYIKLYPQAWDCTANCWDPDPYCIRVDATESEFLSLDNFFEACDPAGDCPATGEIHIKAIGLFCSDASCNTCTSYCTPAECDDCQ